MCHTRKVCTPVCVISFSLGWLDCRKNVHMTLYQCFKTSLHVFSCTFRTLLRLLYCIADTPHVEYVRCLWPTFYFHLMTFNIFHSVNGFPHAKGLTTVSRANDFPHNYMTCEMFNTCIYMCPFVNLERFRLCE